MRFHIVDTILKTPISRNPKVLKQTIIHKGEIKNIANFSKVVFKPTQNDPEHFHEDIIEIIYILKGTGKLLIDDKIKKLKPNTVVIIYPNESHSIINNSLTDLELIAIAISL